MSADAAPLILACSPRPGGNSDTAAAIFAAAFAEAGGLPPQSLFLRDYPVLPCVACDACAVHARQLARELAQTTTAKDKNCPGQELAGAGLTGSADFCSGTPCRDTRSLLTGLPLLGCPLSKRDSSPPLLRALALAPLVCISAPLYFYHLPAMLKGLLDRLQAFWSLRENGINLFHPQRPCAIMLMGARPRGRKLFEGSLLSLRYALAQTGLEVGEPLLFYGLDGPGDFAASGQARAQTAAYAGQAARALAGGRRP